MTTAPITSTATTAAPEAVDRVVLVRGRIPHRTTGWLAVALRPVAWIRDALRALYDGLLELMWRELIHGEANRDQGTQLAAAGLLVAFAMIAYHFDGYAEFAVLTIVGLWVLDFALAHFRFRRPASFEQYVLERKGDGLLWKGRHPRARAMTQAVSPRQVKCVAVDSLGLAGGAFRDARQHVWRLSLVLVDEEGLPLAESARAGEILQQARRLGAALGVPVELMGAWGVGDGVPAAGRMAPDPAAFESTGTIRVVETPEGPCVERRLGLREIGALTAEVLHDAGLLLFFLIMASMLPRIGLFLSFVTGHGPSTLHLDLSPAGLLGFFTPELGDWVGWIELAIALGVLAFSTWRHVRARRITFGKSVTRYAIGRRVDATLATRQVDGVFLVHDPAPLVVVADGRGEAAVVLGLHEDEASGMVHALASTLAIARGA